MENNTTEKKKNKSGNFTLILFIVFLLIGIFSFRDHRYLAGIIAILQAGLFGTVWSMKKNIIKDINPAIHTLLFVVGLVLIVPLVMVADKKPLPKYDWPKSGLATRLPKPKSNKGEIHTDSEDSFWIEVSKTTEKQYNAYLQECKDMGYSIDPDSSWGYEAYDNEGYKLDISYMDTSEEMSITLEAPIKYGKLSWPNSGLAKLIPKPESDVGKVERDSSDQFMVYISNTTKDDFNKYIDSCSNRGFNVGYDRNDSYYRAENVDGYKLQIAYEGNTNMSIKIDKPDEPAEISDVDKETENTKDVTEESTEEAATEEISTEEASAEESTESSEDKEGVGDKLADSLIREDIKEAIDSYEAFVDEYCEFMKSYDSSDLSMLTKYTKLISKEVEMAKEFEDIEDKDLTDAEALYYTEVSLRCSEKMLKAASQMK